MTDMARPYKKTGFGIRLGEFRRERGYRDASALAKAVADLDADVKVTRSTIINLEAGRKADPTVGEVMVLARALDVYPAALLFDLDNPFAPTQDTPPRRGDQHGRLLPCSARVLHRLGWW